MPLQGPLTALAELSQLIIAYCFASVSIVLRSRSFTAWEYVIRGNIRWALHFYSRPQMIYAHDDAVAPLNVDTICRYSWSGHGMHINIP